MKTLNVGILAHVDAGKTSLTERLLYAAGVIDRLGSVDAGSTQTDSLALEQRRGITIRSAVASFPIGDTTVNLIDTPGHPDFIAEVERVLSVLDGTVLVISAVEGVQPQTKILMRVLERLSIPTLIFVNKIDRRGARDDSLLAEINKRLAPNSPAMGRVADLGTRTACFVPFAADDPRLVTPLADALADHDDTLLATLVDGESVSGASLTTELARQTGRAWIHPVFFGSALTGNGVDSLMSGIRQFLTSPPAEEDGPTSGTVFKVERGRGGERLAYVRMFTGTLRVRDRLPSRTGERAKVTGIEVFGLGGTVESPSVRAGQIARLRGLSGVQVGDPIGAPRVTAARSTQFALPSLETIVDPVRAEDAGRLHVAMTQLAEQDPLIDVRHDDVRHEISVSLYGEVQKEVIEATLAHDYGVEVAFRETTTICTERPISAGCAVEHIDVDPNPFLATIGLRVEPGRRGSGVGFALEVERGAMPAAFFTAVEATVRVTLGQGLHGWPVTDCVVTMTHSGYWPRQSHMHAVFDKSMSSTARDFRRLTPLVLMAALREAGTCVYEPIHRFELEVPAETLGEMLGILAQLGAVPRTTEPRGSTYVLVGDIPAARVHELRQRLPGLTHGDGVLTSVLDHEEPVRGVVPERSRTDDNPLNRREYLLLVSRDSG